jgi:hypothetical protein
MKQILQRLLFGPFFYLKDRWLLSLVLVSLVGVLTVLTQVGGVLLWLSLPVLAKVPSFTPLKRRTTQCFVFSVLYGLCIVLVLPVLAPLNGRVPLPWFATSTVPLKPANFGYCLLARNYVRPPVRQLLERTALTVSQQFPGTTLHYLDANFPFLNGFPLLPHLSHHDGRKVDLAFFYQDTQTKTPLPSPPSPIGYWAYEQPTANEPQPCRGIHSWLRWNFDWFQPLFASAEIDPERTRVMAQTLLAEPTVQKMLIEPHLKARLRLQSSKVRFQGCGAARHDDHIHVQILR